MTGVMLALYQWLPWHERYPLPPWRITYRLLRRSGEGEHMEGDEQEAVALVNHFGYGAATGALYGLLARIFSIRSIWGGVGFRPVRLGRQLPGLASSHQALPASHQ